MKKQLLFEILGFYLAWYLLFTTGSITLIFKIKISYIYGLLTLFSGVIGLIIIQIILLIAKRSKKLNKSKVRTIFCYGSILSFISTILGLIFFTPGDIILLAGGITGILIIFISHFGSLVINKNKYFSNYKILKYNNTKTKMKK